MGAGRDGSPGDGARWAELGADLSARAAARRRAERAQDAADLGRAAVGEVTLLDRLRAATGRRVVVQVRGAGRLTGVLTRAGTDVLVLREDSPAGRPDGEVLLPLVALLSLTGIGTRARPDRVTPATDRRLGLARDLRACATARVTVRLVLVDGTTCTGTVDAVGADHLELAEHPDDVPRRRVHVTGRRVVPFPALAAVHRPPLARDG